MGRAVAPRVDLKAWHEDYAPAFVPDYEVDAGGEAEILLGHGGTLKGRILRDGQPAAGLRVHGRLTFGRPFVAGITPNDRPAYLAMTYTGEDGAYEIHGLPPGRYIIRIMDAEPVVPIPARYWGRLWADVEEGTEVVLNCDARQFSVIQGRVTGLPDPAQAVMSLCDARYPDEPLYRTGEKHDSIGPDEHGAFRFGPVPAGSYIVRAATADDPALQMEQNCAVNAGKTLDLTLEF